MTQVGPVLVPQLDAGFLFPPKSCAIASGTKRGYQLSIERALFRGELDTAGDYAPLVQVLEQRQQRGRVFCLGGK